MAAMRSALAMLRRRSCSNSASSAPAYMAGRGLEIRQLSGLSAPRTPSLRPAAGRNLEGWQRFSTESMEGADQKRPLLKQKAEGMLRMWWLCSRNYVKNFLQGDRSFLVLTKIGFVASLCYVMVIFWGINRNLQRCSSARSSSGLVRSRLGTTMMTPYSMMPAFRVMKPSSFASPYYEDEDEDEE